MSKEWAKCSFLSLYSKDIGHDSCFSSAVWFLSIDSTFVFCTLMISLHLKSSKAWRRWYDVCTLSFILTLLLLLQGILSLLANCALLTFASFTCLMYLLYLLLWSAEQNGRTQESSSLVCLTHFTLTHFLFFLFSFLLLSFHLKVTRRWFGKKRNNRSCNQLFLIQLLLRKKKKKKT